MDEPLLPPKASTSGKVGSATDIAHMDHGKSSGSSPTNTNSSPLPLKSASSEKSTSFDQKLKNAAHKPATWGILIAFLVLIIVIILLIRKYKQRKQQRINDDKTKMMMRWHQDRGLV